MFTKLSSIFSVIIMLLGITGVVPSSANSAFVTNDTQSSIMLASNDVFSITLSTMDGLRAKPEDKPSKDSPSSSSPPVSDIPSQSDPAPAQPAPAPAQSAPAPAQPAPAPAQSAPAQPAPAPSRPVPTQQTPVKDKPQKDTVAPTTSPVTSDTGMSDEEVTNTEKGGNEEGTDKTDKSEKVTGPNLGDSCDHSGGGDPKRCQTGEVEVVTEVTDGKEEEPIPVPPSLSEDEVASENDDEEEVPASNPPIPDLSESVQTSEEGEVTSVIPESSVTGASPSDENISDDAVASEPEKEQIVPVDDAVASEPEKEQIVPVDDAVASEPEKEQIVPVDAENVTQVEKVLSVPEQVPAENSESIDTPNQNDSPPIVKGTEPLPPIAEEQVEQPLLPAVTEMSEEAVAEDKQAKEEKEESEKITGPNYGDSCEHHGQGDPERCSTPKVEEEPVPVESATENSYPINFNTAICPYGTSILTVTCTGQQQVFQDVTVNPGVSVSEVQLAGNSVNKGWLSNIRVLPDSIVEGGVLSGTVINEGTIKNVQFKGASIKGGNLSGTIGVEKGRILTGVTLLRGCRLDGGILENAVVQEGVQLTNVTLGKDVHLSDNVFIGEGVRFSEGLDEIAGTRLTAFYSKNFAAGYNAVDLQATPIEEISSLWAQIQSIKELQGVVQNPTTGLLEVVEGTTRSAWLPLRVTQIGTGESPGVTHQPDGSLRIITVEGQEIIAYPSLQDPEEFQKRLGEPANFSISPSGIIRVQTETAWKSYYAAPTAEMVDGEQQLGLVASPEDSGVLQLFFSGEQGEVYKQLIYPSCGYVENTLDSQFPLSALTVEGNNLYGTCDPEITPISAENQSQFKPGELSIIASDEAGKWIILYPTGEQQVFYVANHTLKEVTEEQSSKEQIPPLYNPPGSCGIPTLSAEELANSTTDDLLVETKATAGKIAPKQRKKLWHDEATLEVNELATSIEQTLSISSLRLKDMPPLAPGMINVTKGPRAGYRFLPHRTKFGDKQVVKIPYDRQKLPPGFREQDVRTYYFDEQQCRWLPLERVEVDSLKTEVVSHTDHFTDMINAVSNSPDAPIDNFKPEENMGFAQRTSPSRSIQLCEPPKANQKGDVEVHCPLQVPAGRNQLQPTLSLNYSSAAGNDWLGMNWALAVPAISIDERWGSPRYDAEFETETYIWDGEQLTPMVHRSALVPRTAEKVFRSRVQGEEKFHKIIRHGNSPKNYWWEVVDKSGTIYRYGANSTGQLPEAVLSNSEGNVFKWFLREVVDTQGNHIQYRYTKVEDVGLENGSVPGYQVYLQTINYTGYGEQLGAYQIRFIRDRELGEARRKDVIVKGIAGLKLVTADRLRFIEMYLHDQLIRRYELSYITGPFAKSLLYSLKAFGEDGSYFNEHNFEYYDDIRDEQGRYKGFNILEEWITEQDMNPDLRGEAVPGILGSVHSETSGGALYLGLNDTYRDKIASLGARFGFKVSKTEGLTLFLDITGDNLPDKVFKQGDGVYYRPNLSGPNGNIGFGEVQLVAGLPAISIETASLFSVGPEIYQSGSKSFNDSNGFTTTTSYFADINGDGLVDFVYEGKALYNRLAVNGHPVFAPDSSQIPAPFVLGDDEKVQPSQLLKDHADILRRMEKVFPLIDTVIRWEAPFDGEIQIIAPVALLENTSPARQQYQHADGVQVSIQHNNEVELWKEIIGPQDYTPKIPQNVDAITVKAKDIIYFRVHSRQDGSFDQVRWLPDIRYLNQPETLDVNGLDIYHYNFKEDFFLTGYAGMYISMPFPGTIRVTGELQKLDKMSDDITLQLFKNEEVIFEQQLTWDQVGSIVLNENIAVLPQDQITAHVKIDSQVDLKQLVWKADNKLTLTYVQSPTVAIFNEEGDYLIKTPMFCSYDLYPYTNLAEPLQPWQITQTEELLIESLLEAVDIDPELKADVVLTFKRDKELVEKRIIHIENGVISNESFSWSALAGDEIYVELNTTEPRVLELLTLVEAKASSSSTVEGADLGNEDSILSIPLAFRSVNPYQLIAQPYRSWNIHGYDLSMDEGNTSGLINISKQDLTGEYFKAAIEELRLAEQAGTLEAFDATKLRLEVVPFVPFIGVDKWMGPDEHTWATDEILSSSRWGADHLEVPDVHSPQFSDVRAVPMISQSRAQARNSSADVYHAGSESGSSVTGLISFMDLNGDGCLDIIGNGWVQYTQLACSLGHSKQSINAEVLRESGATGKNTVGSNPSQAMVSGNGKVNNLSSEAPLVGVEGSQIDGSASGISELKDMTGDGIADRIFYIQGQLWVSIGTGYTFEEPELWGPADLFMKSAAESLPGAIGFNTGNYSFAGGNSLSRNTSENYQLLEDINHDQLPDFLSVSASNKSIIRVAFNTGHGFAEPVDWPNVLNQALSVQTETSLGTADYFTIGIGPLVCGEDEDSLEDCYMVFNPGLHAGRSVNRSEVQLQDVDGDGNAELLFSQRDDKLQVASSPIGRTNLLKTVQRPLGGQFTVDYERLGNTYAQPLSKWVIKRLEVHDGHPGDGADVQVTAFSHEHGFINRQERDFYGFQRVLEDQLDEQGQLYRRTIREFHNDSYYNHGLLIRETVVDNQGRPFKQAEKTYSLKDVDTAQEVSTHQHLTATVFPELRRSDKRFYEGHATPGKSTYQTYEYDPIGNLIRLFDANNAEILGDDLDFQIGYFQDPVRYILNKPNFLQIRGNGQLMRHRQANFELGTGNRTQVREYLENGQVAVTDYEYDGYGNITSVLQPSNYRGQRLLHSYQYDDTVHSHITQIQNSFGYTSKFEYNFKYGEKTRVTDPNQQSFYYHFDAFGRLQTVTSPNEWGSRPYSIRYEYHHLDAVPWVLTQYFDVTNASDPIETVTFVDGLDRVVQFKKDNTIFGGISSPAVNVMTVSGRVKWDFVGRMVEEYYPGVETLGQTGVFNSAWDTVSPTRYHYDLLDRVVLTELPDNTYTKMDYDFGFDRENNPQFKVVETDANGNLREVYCDIRALCTSLKQFNRAQPIWTSYRYDPLGQIISVTDDQNNVTTASYDELGRRVIIDSPDSGREEKVYDLASNQIRRITSNLRAQGQAVVYDYDFNRLSSIAYPNYPENNVTYTYGEPGALYHRANRLVSVRDESGTEEYFYGRLGETVRTMRTIASDTQGNSTNSPEVYVTQYTRDTWNRLLSLIYPDGEVLTQYFNSGGLLNRITGEKGFSYRYLNRLEYDKFESKVYREVGNGVYSQFTYNPLNRRLDSLKTVVSGSGVVLQDLSYSYDNVGNMLTQANAAAVTSSSQKGGTTDFSYYYDDLYRLVQASGRFQQVSKSNVYRLGVEYDSIHNILFKDQQHEIQQPSQTPILQKETSHRFAYTYAGPQPHAPTQIGDYHFSYDGNGNQLGWTGQGSVGQRLISWDEDNRVQSIQDGGQTMRYRYDHTGKRAMKLGPQGETVYVNSYFVIRNGSVATKHVYAGDVRIGSKLVKSADKKGHPVEEKELYFYHRDHLGSGAYITDAIGGIYQHLEYFPFGETFVEEVSNTQRTPFLFTAKELDEETNLYYVEARYFDPRTGVWLSTDPILDNYLDGYPNKGVFDPVNLSVYTYVKNNPINFIDPTGLWYFYCK